MCAHYIENKTRAVKVKEVSEFKTGMGANKLLIYLQNEGDRRSVNCQLYLNCSIPAIYMISHWCIIIHTGYNKNLGYFA